MELTYDKQVLQGLLAGIDKLANTVKLTLGPKGRNVALYQKANLQNASYSDPARADSHVLITNDGATISKSLVLDDPLENMGVCLIQEIASKVNAAAGDGTTTAIVLTQAILHSAFRNLAAGADPVAMRRGIQKAARTATETLLRRARPIRTPEEIAQVAMISCQDTQLSGMIGQALDCVGLEGVISVEDSQRTDTTMELLEGIVFDRGFLSPKMATDELQSVAELHDPYILLCDAKFTDPQDLIPALILAAEDERSCLIVSDGVEGDAMGLVLKNKIEGDMDIVCVTAPLYGEGRKWRMEDLAVQTGGTYITKELGENIREVTRDMLGTAAYVKVTRQQTIITGAGGNPDMVQNRIQELQYLVGHTDYEFNRQRYRERLATFVSGVAKISVGGRTEPEIWERKMRAEDAVHAARAAYEEGVVPGGGTALLNLIPQVQALAASLTGDEQTGARAVAEALAVPAWQIFENAGLDGNALLARLMEQKDGFGYDVCRDEFVDMLAYGISDPVKVTRLALECALSASATLLTTQSSVTAKK